MAASQTISIRLGVDGGAAIKSALEGLEVAVDATSQRVKSSLEALSSGDVGGKLADQLTASATRIAALQKALSTATVSGNTDAQVAIQNKLNTAMQGYAGILDRTRASISPLAAAEQARAKEIANATNAVKAGAATEDEASAARARAQATYEKQTAGLSASTTHVKENATSTKAAAQVLRDFGIQSQDVFVQLASGGSVFTTLTQQGSQIAQSMMAAGQGFGALKAAASLAISGITSLPGLLLSATAGLVAAGVAAESTNRQWASLSLRLAATRSDYQALADAADASTRRIAQTTSLTVADAKSAYQIIASSADFRGTQAQLEDLIALTGKMARAFGTDVPAQAEKLASAMASPTAAIKQMAEQGIKTANYETIQLVESLERQNDKFGASMVVADAYKRSLLGVKNDGLTPLQTAFENLGKATTLASGKGLFQGLGEAVIGDLAHFVEEITTLINSAKEIKSWVESHVNNGTIIDANTGTATNGVTLPEGTSNKIYSIAEANNISAQIADLATRVARQESGGFQLNGDGTLKTNGRTGTDARYGIGQVSAALAAQYGQDYTTETGNITTMLKNLSDLSKKYNGNEQYTSAAYNAGPGRFDSILAGKATIPDETAKYVQGVTGSALTIQAGSAVIEGKGGEALANNQIVVSSGGNVSDYMTLANDALKGSGAVSADASSGNVNATRQAAIESATKYANALEILAAAGITSGNSVDELTARMNAANAAATNALTPAQEYIRSLKDQATVTAQQTEGDKALYEVRQRITEIERSTGTTFSAAEKAQAEAAAVTNLSNSLKATEFEMGRQVIQNTALTAAYGQGSESVIHVTAQQQAYQTLLQKFPQDAAAIQAALPDLTKKYENVARSAKETALAQQNLTARNNLEYIAAETSSLGQNEAERTRNLAVLKATQGALRDYNGDLTEASKESIRLAAATADATSALQHQQAVTSEIGTFFTNTFDTIGNAITSAFATGELSALKFKDIAKSVASAVLSEFAKLAILNPLKSFLFGSSNSTVTLGDVLGFLDGGSSVGARSSGSGASAAAALFGAGSAFSGGGSTITNSGDNISSNVTTSGGTGVLSSVGGVATLASGADKLGLFGDLFKGGTEGVIATIGDKIVTGITDLLGNGITASSTEIAAQAAAQSAASAAGGTAAEVATAVLPGELGSVEGVSSIARLAAGVSEAAGATTETATAIATAASSVADALPYIGAVISIGTSLISGDYRGAGFTAGGALAGAAIGTLIGFPGIGTAIGAVVGSLASSLFPAHPLHSYQGTEVMVQNGQVVAGKTASQVQSSDEAVSSINDFGRSLDLYMEKVGIVLTNLDGTLGDVGQGITGLTQYTSVADPAILSKLQFAGNPNDTSNFGVAKGALVDMQFNTITDLNNELLKIVGFADAASAVGIQLKHVAKDLTNIQIASVTGGNANALGTVTDAQGNLVQYHNDLRTALNADLPGQTFADTTALDTEIAKVNTFVNQTVPQLLTPIEQTSSSITTAVDNIAKTYSDAINQSQQYGLDNTAVLLRAEQDAIAIIRRTALMALTQNQTSIVNRFLVATNDNVYTQQQATLDALMASQANEIETYTKSWTDIFGDGIKSSAVFQAALGTLVTTLGVEYSSKLAATNKAIKAQYDSLWQSFQSTYMVRDLQAQGNNQAADLLTYDVKAEQERQTYIDQQEAFWGDQIVGNEGFQNQLALIDKVHGEERLAIVQKYATAATTTLQTAVDTTLSQAQGQVTSLFGNLTTYAHGLQTGSDSPLSPMAQYQLASKQFDAVAGAAKAGDYTSASQLQTYSQSLVSSARAVYGSGQGYADTVTRVLDAISGTAANADMLTLSAQQALVREQTQAQVDAAQKTTDAVVALQAEVTAMRREMMSMNRNLALAA